MLIRVFTCGVCYSVCVICVPQESALCVLCNLLGQSDAAAAHMIAGGGAAAVVAAMREHDESDVQARHTAHST